MKEEAHSNLLVDYMRQVEPTDKLPPNDLRPILLGLFGEVGSITATAKKLHREKKAYAGYRHAVIEEFGDALWYLTALCRRVRIGLDAIFSDVVAAGESESALAALELDSTLLKLGEAAAALLSLTHDTANAKEILRSFADWYLKGLKAARMTLDQVAEYNVAKTLDEDGYRFHDVFHFAHASILHWSPTFRALIKHKRKSNPKIDETQDGGRAIVVEEGLTAWIFSRAKELGFFESQSSVSFDMLKTVQQFVRGYEVEECPLKLWEHAILQGYEVFRQVRANNGGTIVGNRTTRTVGYKAAAPESGS